MDLILVADGLDNAQPLLKVAEKFGYQIVKLIESDADASDHVEALRPDAMVLASDDIDHNLAFINQPLIFQVKSCEFLAFTVKIQQF